MGRSAVLTIKEAAATLGIHPTTLRRWERAGIIPPAMRRRGFRVYTADDMAAIKRAVFAAPIHQEAPGAIE
jgi:excisionase family DNA binding protein